MTTDLGNKIILITGASSGIGKSVAFNILNMTTAKLYLVGRNAIKLQELYTNFSGRICCIEYDLRDVQHIESIYMQIPEKLDGLVHCAGISPLMKVEDNDIETMLDTFSINCLSFIELCKYFYFSDNSNDEASIVTITSVATKVASYRQCLYSSSKAALEQSVKCISKEFLDRKIRVNAVSAGAVETEMFKDLEAKSEGLRSKLEKYYPLGMIKPEELANLIIYLLSKDAIHVDGSIISIDSAFFINK